MEGQLEGGVLPHRTSKNSWPLSSALLCVKVHVEGAPIHKMITRERAVVASDSVTRLSLQLEFVCLIKKGTI